MVNRNQKREIKRLIPFVVFVAAFILFAFVSYCSPLVSDDLEFAGTSFNSFSDITDYVLKYGNGRVLGNYGAVIMSKYKLVSVFVRGLFIALLTVLIPAVSCAKNKNVYIISFLLCTCCGMGVFAQCFSWISGFQNFVPPIVFFLSIVFVIQRFDNKPKHLRILSVFYCILVGFAMQLYAEHCTATALLCACAYAFYCFKKKNSKRSVSLSVLFSSLFGAIVMFFVPRVFDPSTDAVSNYRQLLFTSPVKIARNFFVICELLSTNIFFIVLFTACVVYILIKNRDLFEDKKSIAVKTILFSSFICVISHNLIFNEEYFGRWKFFVFAFNSLFFFAYCVCILFILWKCRQKYNFVRVFVPIVVSIICCGMLLFVSPIGDRCILFPYVLLCVALFNLMSEVKIIKEKKFKDEIFTCAVVVTAICVTLSMSIMFCGVKFADDMRTNYIIDEMNKGANEIEVFDIPYTRVFQADSNAWALGRYYYYNSRGDVHFVVLGYDEWLKEHDEYSKSMIPFTRISS